MNKILLNQIKFDKDVNLSDLPEIDIPDNFIRKAIPIQIQANIKDGSDTYLIDFIWYCILSDINAIVLTIKFVATETEFRLINHSMFYKIPCSQLQANMELLKDKTNYLADFECSFVENDPYGNLSFDAVEIYSTSKVRSNKIKFIISPKTFALMKYAESCIYDLYPTKFQFLDRFVNVNDSISLTTKRVTIKNLISIDKASLIDKKNKKYLISSHFLSTNLEEFKIIQDLVIDDKSLMKKMRKILINKDDLEYEYVSKKSVYYLSLFSCITSIYNNGKKEPYFCMLAKGNNNIYKVFLMQGGIDDNMTQLIENL